MLRDLLSSDEEEGCGGEKRPVTDVARKKELIV